MKQFGGIIIIYFVILQKTEEVIHNGNSVRDYATNDPDISIHKVSFTQKGYIQFLKYVSDVPTLTDYTFCIWVRSRNFTYSQPVLSYSKHEEERLIRFWISPSGDYVNLEILEIPVFKLPVHLLENHWYHFCQSWSGFHGAWNFYLNGKLKSSGFQHELRGVKIDGGGDIVVGQEYTDFDKGLDDGIEGDVFGFNFVLAPTTFSSKTDLSLRRHGTYYRPQQLYQRYEGSPAEDVPAVLSYFKPEINRRSKGIMDFFDILLGPAVPSRIRIQIPSASDQAIINSRILNDFDEFPSTVKPLGLKLVEMGLRCYLGKGAPLQGRDVLISWTKTPVRVFGGAILKSIPPFCV